MIADRVFYFCLICFKINKSETHCHGMRMICCDAGEPNDDQRRPENSGGNFAFASGPIKRNAGIARVLRQLTPLSPKRLW